MNDLSQKYSWARATHPNDKRPWWVRSILTGLFNGVFWLIPPPFHFVSLILPFFSGYSISNSRPNKGFISSVQIAFIMGLTLGSLPAVIGSLIVLGTSLFVEINVSNALVIVGIASGAVGGYTSFAAFLGAVIATHKKSEPAEPKEEGSPTP